MVSQEADQVVSRQAPELVFSTQKVLTSRLSAFAGGIHDVNSATCHTK